MGRGITRVSSRIHRIYESLQGKIRKSFLIRGDIGPATQPHDLTTSRPYDPTANLLCAPQNFQRFFHKAGVRYIGQVDGILVFSTAIFAMNPLHIGQSFQG